MENPNEHVETYLADYITRRDPGFAVLVSAPWGAGKTHLIKELIEKQKEDAKPLYISLFGVKNSDDIDLAILMARMPVLDNDLAKLGGRLGTAAMKLLPIDLSGVKLANISKLQLPQTLIFDDLERTNMGIKELLGYLNGFVEHEKKNLVLLANEDELWKDEDRRAKEKLIGHTLTVRADVDAALAAMIKALEDDGAKQYLTDQQDIVKRVFGQSATNNLRILGQCLWDFERLFKALDKDHRKNDEGMKELLTIFLALSIEFKSGGLEREDMKERANIWLNFQQDDSEKPEPSKLQIAGEKYVTSAPREGLYSSVLPAGFATSLICDGWVAPDEIYKVLSQSHHFAGVKEEAEWATVFWAWSRKEEDVVKAVEAMEEKFAARDYHDAGKVLLVFVSRLRLPEMGFLTIKMKAVEEECRTYIDDLAKTGKLRGFDPAIDWREGYGYDDRAHLGYDWPSDDSPRGKAFWRLRDHMKKTQDRLFEERFPAICDDLLKLMATDADLFGMRLSANNTTDAIYRAHPVLKGMDVVAFVDKLLTLDPSSQSKVLYVLKERHAYPAEKLREEGDWLKGVQKELSGRMSSLSDFKRWQLENNIDVNLAPLIKAWDKAD